MPVPPFIEYHSNSIDVGKRLMKWGVLISCFLFFICTKTNAQVTTIDLDLSASSDTVININNAPNRNGLTCGNSGNGNVSCILFNVKLNPKSDQINVEIFGAQGSLTSSNYQVNCGQLTALATPICLNGITTASISFCKSGNNPYTYRITASTLVKGSADLTLRENCTGTMSVSGLQTGTVNWTSVNPGTQGQYDNYLSCTTGCVSTNVTPQVGAPAYIDYRVYGSTTSCGTAKSDTIRVYTTPALTVPITPANPAICSGASVTLNASVSGGNRPYSYTWNTGATDSAITVNTIGTYTVTVSDNTSGCTPVPQSVTVTAASTPVPPTVAGTTICAGNTATLTASAPGGTYDWYDAATGGNRVFTGDSFTTPVLNSTTTYYVQTTVSACSSSRTAVTVTVNPSPSSPTASGATICAGTSVTLTATAPGGSYEWFDAASGGQLLITGSSFPTPILNSNTSFYVQTTVAGCTSIRTPVAVSVTPLPSAPTATVPAICSGNTATLTATGAGGSYQWFDAATGGNLLTGSAVYTTPVLTVNTTFYVSTTVASCTSTRTPVSVTVNPIPAAPTAAPATICSGNTATLTATAPGGNYQWYDAAGGGNVLTSNASYTSPVLTNTTSYFVGTTINGCAGPRTTVTVTVNPIPSAPAASGTTLCAGNTATLTASASSGSLEWYSAVTGGTPLITGNGYTTPVLQNTTTYYVQNTVSGCSSNRTAVTATVNPIPTAPIANSATICAGNAATLLATSPGGTYDWFTNSVGGVSLATNPSYITPVISNTTNYYVQTTIGGCASNRTQVTVTVNPIPAAPTAAPATICAGNATTLSASAPGGSYQWYDAISNGNLLSSLNSYQTAVLNTTTSYYVQTTISGCTSSRAKVTVSVTPLPAAPTVTGSTVCAGNSTSLTATSPGGNYQWFDVAGGGSALASGSVFNTQVLTKNSTYYVETSINGCTGPRSSVTVQVNPSPVAPTVADATICAGNITALTATAPGGIYQWYDAATNGNLLNTGNVFQTPALTSQTAYYVQTTVNGCACPRSKVNVFVNPVPAAPTVANKAICAGNATLLSASAPGGIYQWYDAATGGNLLTTNNNYSTPALTVTTQFFVQATLSGCTGPRSAVTVTVTPIPAAPSVTDQTACENNPVTFMATAPGGTYEWYDAAANGILLATNASYTTKALSQTTPFYVQSTISGCIGPRAKVTANIIPKQDPAFVYPSGTFCISGTNPTPALIGSGTGMFSASPAGLVFNNTTTGEINLAASALNTYTIQFVTSGACSYSSSSKITITGSPNASFSYNGPVCQQEKNIVPLFPSGASAGVFTASPAGLSFLNASTGEIDLTKTNPGIYTITNDIVAGGGCAAAKATNTITVNQAALVDAGNNQTVCYGTAINLQGTIGGSATKAIWSGGKGQFLDANSLTTQYQPDSTETQVKLYLTSDDPAGSCQSATDSLLLFITPKPGSPVVQGGAICSGTKATLIATAPGGKYSWFADATSNTALADTNTFTTNILSTATTFYVQTAINNCQSDRVPVNVNVTPKPAIISASQGAVCSGSPTNYLLLSNLAGTSFNWVRSSVSGIANPAESGLTDSSLHQVLINTTSNPIQVSFIISPTNNNCTGVPFTYVVTVNPTPATPVVTSSSPVCVGSVLKLYTPSVTGASYDWNGPNKFSSGYQNPVIDSITTLSAGIYSVSITVNGCTSAYGSKNVFPVIAAPVAGSNGPVCQNSSLQLTAGSLAGASYQWSGPGGFSSVLQNPLIGSATTANAGTYYITASIAGCAGLTDSTSILVNLPPSAPGITSNSPVCTKDSITLSASTVSGGSYQWSGPNGFSSVEQKPVIENAGLPYDGLYQVIVSTKGCAITSNASIAVKVKNTPTIPVAGSNGPICLGSPLNLYASAIAGADYEWRSPSGFFSNLQNPVINKTLPVNAEKYFVVAKLDGCTSDTGVIQVSIVSPSIAEAGNDVTVCANNAPVGLNGTISGEETQTGIWQTNGDGRFIPDNTQSAISYLPGNADTANKKVVLQLSTTQNKVCPISVSSKVVTITPPPFVNAGPDLSVCSNDSLVSLQGSIDRAGGGIWTSLGSGNFISQDPSLKAVYLPSVADIKKGSVSLYLTSTGNGNCLAKKDTLQALIKPAPLLDLGKDKIIFENETLTLTPTTLGNIQSYQWSPVDNLSDPGIENPVLTGKQNVTYTLVVRDDLSCTAKDTVFIRVLKPLKIPNIFSPNGDGIYDVWNIPELANYPGSRVAVFTRSGQLIFSSTGYDKPWDGTYQGNPVPVATYYYIIHTNYLNAVFSGSVTIIR